MNPWPDRRIIRLLRIENPFIQAPMAGADTPDLAAAVSEAGGLGSLACAMLSPDGIREAWHITRSKTDKPVNLNFFCHKQKAKSPAQEERWKQRLMPYYRELGILPDENAPSAARAPFDESFCDVIEDIKPPVVSFHFGLPDKKLLDRVKNSGAIVLSSATTVGEAIWLERQGCDAIIAQGVEAGGHRGLFLTDDLSTQTSASLLLSQVIKAISIPVIAAGGIADAKGMAEALALGAAAVQLGTAYLFCPEARISPVHRTALATDAETALTNVFSGRPARGIVNRFINEVGPMSPDAPDFPHASTLVAPLRRASENSGREDFAQMWSGQVRKAHSMTAGTLTKTICEQALNLLQTEGVKGH
jgi:nitronate monooxygenase